MGAVICLLPVLAFLFALVLLDSYKLLRLGFVFIAIAAGAVAALLSGAVHSILGGLVPRESSSLPLYLAPFVEEITKGGFIALVICQRRVGFMIDAAILGFAVGTGFAMAENIVYVSTAAAAEPVVWVIRGCGTALMHGSTCALFSAVSQHWLNRRQKVDPVLFLPGLALAIAAHSLYNLFLVSPLFSALIAVLFIPGVTIYVFRRSESSLRRWLGVGFDTDAEFLLMLSSGKIGTTRAGRYLQSLRHRFPTEVFVDMVCVLRLQVELSLRAKGILMLQGAGYAVPAQPDVAEKLAELRYLRKSIGATGWLALKPVLNRDRREFWQLKTLNAQ